MTSYRSEMLVHLQNSKIQEKSNSNYSTFVNWVEHSLLVKFDFWWIYFAIDCLISNLCLIEKEVTLWSWSYGSWLSNYLYNQCLSQLMLWVRTPLMRGVLDTTLYETDCKWLATGRWFSPGTRVSSSNKTDHHDIQVTEILLKVAWNTINQTKPNQPLIEGFNIGDIQGNRSTKTLKLLKYLALQSFHLA